MKLIINNQTNRSLSDILHHAKGIVEEGRISDEGKSYCYVTKFYNGVVCGAKRNKNSDTLTFWEEGQ